MARSSPTSSSGASPPSAGQPGGKRETLAARAQRIIGKVLDTDEPPNNGPSAKRGPPKKSPTRRREQVLQAQRTHRQRTQGYIKELEKEVLRLREREMNLVEQNESLLQTIERLKHALQSYNVPLPLEIPATTSSIPGSSPEPLHHTAPFAIPPSNAVDSPFLDRATFSEPPVTINLTEIASVEPMKPCSITAALDYPTPYEDPPTDLAQAFRTYASHSPVSQTKSSNSRVLSATLSPQCAVDFVLELERPCLPHIKYRYMIDLQAPPGYIPEFNSGPGHTFTATASLINTHWDEQPTTRPFEVPPEDIDRLFQASLSLDLGPDVTPIQIWANLARISLKYPISLQLLRVLTDEFSRYVRCNSFGTVVERSTVDRILGFFFPGETFKTTWSFAAGV